MLPTLHPRRVPQTVTSHRLPTDLNEAFELLYQRYAEPVAGWLVRRLNGNRDLALDLRDEVFTEVWRSLPTWEDRGITIKAWIFRIARDQLIDTYRHLTTQGEKQPFCVDHEALETDEAVLTNDVARRVRHCVAQLDEDQREVIELYWFRQLSFREIARQTGKSEVALRTLHHRGLAHLRELVQRGVFEAPFEQISLPDIGQTRLPRREKARQTPQQPPSLPVREVQPAQVEQLSFFS